MTRTIGMRAAAAAACLAVMSLGAARAQTAGAAGSPPEAAVQKVIEGFMEALNAADIERFSSYFAPDATVFFPVAPVLLRLEDKAQITKVFKTFFEGIRARHPGPQYMSLVPQDLKVQAYGDVAIATFHFKGPDLVSRRTIVLRRDAGGWLIVHLHASGVEVPKE